MDLNAQIIKSHYLVETVNCGVKEHGTSSPELNLNPESPTYKLHDFVLEIKLSKSLPTSTLVELYIISKNDGSAHLVFTKYYVSGTGVSLSLSY